MLRVHNPSGGSAVTAAQVFRGATDSVSGRSGLVPGPAVGQQDMVLLGSGVFGLMTANSCYVYDRYNICGDGINTLVTLQNWCNAVMSKLQARTVFNFDESTVGTGDGNPAQESSGNESVFTKEYVVDTYGLAGDPGTTVSVGTLVSALADSAEARTVWRGNPSEEEETPSEQQGESNEESSGETTSNTEEPVVENSSEDSQSSESNTEENTEEESLKDQILNDAE